MEQMDFVPRKMALFGMVMTGVTGFLCGMLCGYGLGSHNGGETETHTVVDTVRDTVRIAAPRAVDSMQTGVIRIPVVLPSEPEVPKATIKVYNPDSLFVNDNEKVTTRYELQKQRNFARKDTTWATVPRMQKKYCNTLYTAWVSGYEPRLDSISVYNRTVTVTKTQTVTKHNPFSLGIIGGVGYGVFSKKPDAFVGVGGSIRIW